MAPQKQSESRRRRSAAGKKAWRTMRKKAAARSQLDPINLRMGTDGQLLVARLLKKGVCACVLAEATGQNPADVVKASGK